MRGDILLCAGEQTTRVEAAYFAALDVAKSQNARIFELRAATGIARLWQSIGKTKDARQILKPIYDWFTEGSETVDLKEAKALLDELTVS